MLLSCDRSLCLLLLSPIWHRMSLAHECHLIGWLFIGRCLFIKAQNEAMVVNGSSVFVEEMNIEMQGNRGCVISDILFCVRTWFTTVVWRHLYCYSSYHYHVDSQQDLDTVQLGRETTLYAQQSSILSPVLNVSVSLFTLLSSYLPYIQWSCPPLHKGMLRSGFRKLC